MHESIGAEIDGMLQPFADVLSECFARMAKLEGELQAERIITDRLLSAMAVIDPEQHADIIDTFRNTVRHHDETLIAAKVSKVVPEKRQWSDQALRAIMARLNAVVSQSGAASPPPVLSVLPGGKSDISDRESSEAELKSTDRTPKRSC